MTEHHHARCWKVEDWPAVDRCAWETILASGDILDGDAGSASHWKPTTIHKYRRGYGRWLDFLASSERLETTSSPVERISPAHLRAYIAYLEGSCAPFTVYTRISELLAVIHAMAPTQDWSWLKRAVNRLQRRAEAEKPAKAVRSSADLLSWSLDAMAAIQGRSQTQGRIGLYDATRYRDAFIIGLLSLRPVRLRNLAMIELGKHLTQTTEGFHLSFESRETKTGRPISFPLSNCLTGPLNTYLADYRTRLLDGGSSNHLWISQYGQSMTENALYTRIEKVTARTFGQRINPHRFRDCAATTMAIEDPEHVRIVASILGHTTLATAERYYNQAQTMEAGRRYQTGILGLRKQLARENAP